MNNPITTKFLVKDTGNRRLGSLAAEMTCPVRRMSENPTTTKVDRSRSGMQIKVVVKDTGDRGLGLFASENITKGSVIWKLLPNLTNVEIYDEARFTALAASKNKENQQLIRDICTYSYGDVNFGPYLPGGHLPESGIMILPLDEGRYVNHDSVNPNIGDWDCVFTEPGKGKPEYHWTFALRDIKKGEELCETYDTFDHTPWILKAIQEHGIPIDYFQCKVHPMYRNGTVHDYDTSRFMEKDDLLPDQVNMDGAAEAALALLSLASYDSCI